MAGVCLWKTSGSILIVLLIELETKQFSLAFSKTRGMRQIVGGRDQDSRGGFPRQLAFPPRREQLFNSNGRRTCTGKYLAFSSLLVGKNLSVQDQ